MSEIALPPLAPRQSEIPEEQRRREEGTFFSFCESIWIVKTEQFPLDGTNAVEDALGPIRRKKMPSMYESAFSPDNLVKDVAESDTPGRTENSSGSNSSPGRQTDLLGFGNALYQKAHMIPDAPVGSKSYGFIAEAALGLKNVGPETRLKLVKGVQHTVKGGRKERVKQSGLRHNKYNKLRLKMQKEALDENPVLLIVPIMTLEAVLEWDETDPDEDYSYDVMMCAHNGEIARQVCGELFFKHRGSESECTAEEIKTATNLLHTFARSIAMSTYQDNVMESMTTTDKGSRSVTAINSRIDQARKDRFFNVNLPVISPAIGGLTTGGLAARGIRVVKANVRKETSLPDPYLVAVKAAATWFAGRGERMVAAASIDDSEHSRSDTDSEYNDCFSSPGCTGKEDPVENLRRSQLSGRHVHVEIFSAD